MSDEEAWQAALDADPGNSLLRQVFADWLDDRGDPRASGYRVLGALGLWPERGLWHPDRWGRGRTPPGHLPSDWYDRLKGGKPKRRRLGRDAWPAQRASRAWEEWRDTQRDFGNRRDADDAAALAWLDLDDAERRDILTPLEVRTDG
jgi:uncharacterized protein (TIGR02996 family)